MLPPSMVRLRLERAWCGLRLRARRALRRSTVVEMSAFIGFYERMWSEAARQLGVDLIELRPGTWRCTRGSRSTVIDNYIVQFDDPVVLSLAGDKALCHRLVSGAGLPVPAHQVFTLATLDKALGFLKSHPGAYFVVKPSAGTSGARGITTHLRTVGECRRASVLASLYATDLLIERWIAGESYRLLFLDGEMVHASRRRGRRVTGDGTSTIAELIAREAGKGGWSPADGPSRDLNGTLGAQGLTLASIPPRGSSVLVQSACNPAKDTVEIRTVFDEDATALIGPDLLDQAARAVEAIGSRFAGVDIITLDPGLPLEATGGVINEINTTPGLHHHYDLRGDTAADPPAVRVLDRLLRTKSDRAAGDDTAPDAVVNESADRLAIVI